MKRINDLGLIELDRLAEKVIKGDYDTIYAAWLTLRATRKSVVPTDKPYWTKTILRMIEELKECYKAHTSTQRFLTTGTINMEIQVFVMGGYDNEPYECGSQVVLTVI